MKFYIVINGVLKKLQMYIGNGNFGTLVVLHVILIHPLYVSQMACNSQTYYPRVKLILVCSPGDACSTYTA